MNLADLNTIARAMVAPGKGILAADESSGTIKKRFDVIGVESTETSRRDYREMMFRAAEGMKHISGVILYDETIWQKGKDGTPLVDVIKKAGALPGIKVDEGTKPLPNCPGELITIGLVDANMTVLTACATRADMAYQVAKAIAAREQQIVWEDEYTGLHEVFSETPSSPMDVPLHAGTQKFWKEWKARGT